MNIINYIAAEIFESLASECCLTVGCLRYLHHAGLTYVVGIVTIDSDPLGDIRGRDTADRYLRDSWHRPLGRDCAKTFVRGSRYDGSGPVARLDVRRCRHSCNRRRV